MIFQINTTIRFFKRQVLQYIELELYVHNRGIIVYVNCSMIAFNLLRPSDAYMRR